MDTPLFFENALHVFILSPHVRFDVLHPRWEPMHSKGGHLLCSRSSHLSARRSRPNANAIQ
jgi:hypothetical protein